MLQNHFEYTITKDSSGERIDRFLSAQLKAYSRSQLQKFIDEEYVLLNGKMCDKKSVLREGDLVQVTIGALAFNRGHKPQPQKMDLDIIYEDEHIVAINKDAGMIVHPGNGAPDGTLVNGLMHRFDKLSDGSDIERPGIIHRLDKETSGILLVAKNNTAHMNFSKLFAARAVKKEYIAFCIGHQPASGGIIDSPLARNRRDPIKRAVSPDGKSAVTEYQCLDYHNGIAAVRFLPRTGRTHQIRVHCSSIGFPIVMDELYGGRKDKVLLVAVMERSFAYSVFKCFDRHALHAHKISFVHPFSGEQMTLEAPIPDDFRNAEMVFGKRLF